MMQTGITEWLRAQHRDDLLTVLGNRADCLSPEPRSLTALGDRLSSPTSIRLVLRRLDLGCLELLDALRALGDGAGADDLRRLLDVGGATAETDYERALRELQRHALVWPDRGTRLRLAGPLRNAEGALRLGAGLRVLLKPLTVAQLKSIAEKLGLDIKRNKQGLVDAIHEAVSDSPWMRDVIAQAPAEAQRLTENLVWQSPRLAGGSGGFAHYGEMAWGSAGQRWLMQRGLLLPAPQPAPHGCVEMPREVALALRGPDYRAPLTPRPSEPVTVAVEAADVDSTAAVAASSIVDGVTRLLELTLREPIGMLRTGGVGVRELRRLAKSLRSTVDAVRLWLELAAAAELLLPDSDGIRPTSYGEQWRRKQPADRIGPLLQAWWDLAETPTSTASADKPPAALLGSAEDHDRQLRHAAIGALAELDTGYGVRDRTELDRLLAWEYPHLDLASATALWAEAEQVGVVAIGALSSLGTALLREPDRIADAAKNLLPAAEETIRLQADLTALVGGTPSANLTALLDLMADQQQRDTASIWRFSATSIRRALDHGYSAADLIAELRAVSTAEIPQPLEYLINDTARRHGEVEVVPVACCVVGQDEAVLTEMCHNRALKELGLRPLAATVLASGKPPARTVELLRHAGYAPLQRNKSGDIVIERNTAKVASEPRPVRPVRKPAHATSSPPQGPNLRRLAEKLLAPSEPTLALDDGDDLEKQIAEQNPDMSEGERLALADSLRRNSPIEIDYVDQNGTHSVRTITPLAVNYHWLEAHCHLRNGERNFRIDRIRGITVTM
jgi:hypothetical protein